MQSVPASTEKVHFVLRRANGHWTPAATVIAVKPSLEEAEAEAERLRELYPHQVFGTAPLVSEARLNSKPVETVRVA